MHSMKVHTLTEIIKTIVGNLKDGLNYDHPNNDINKKLMELGRFILERESSNPIRDEDKQRFITFYNQKSIISVPNRPNYEDNKRKYENEIDSFIKYLQDTYPQVETTNTQDDKNPENDFLQEPETKTVPDLNEGVSISNDRTPTLSKMDEPNDQAQVSIPVNPKTGFVNPNIQIWAKIENYDDELIDERMESLHALLIANRTFIKAIGKKLENPKADEIFQRVIAAFNKTIDNMNYLNNVTRPSDDFKNLINAISSAALSMHELVSSYDHTTKDKIEKIEKENKEISDYIVQLIIDETKKM